MSRRKRHHLIDVPDSWLEQVAQWRLDQGMTLKEFGVALGDVESGKPYVVSSVSRMLDGQVSAEMAAAVVELTGIALPVSPPDTNTALKLWNEIGQELFVLDERLLLLLLQDVTDIVRGLRRIKHLKTSNKRS